MTESQNFLLYSGRKAKSGPSFVQDDTINAPKPHPVEFFKNLPPRRKNG